MERLSRRNFLKYAGLSTLGLAMAGRAGAQGRSAIAKKPNIVLIMVDDMGYSDMGCYGGEINTPNLDKLAGNGLRFTQFYNAARCCPTRASILTGQYQHRVGLRFNGQSLTKDGVTIAEALKGGGYNTAMVGKWHLSETRAFGGNNSRQHFEWLNNQDHFDRPFAPLETYPVNRGFDKFYGVIWGVINFWNPFSLVEGTEPVRDLPEDYFFTRAISEKAVEYVNEMSKSDDPFFLYYSFCAPHWPLHALPEDIAKYKGKYDQGWDKLREDRYKRQIEMGLFEEHNTPLPPVQTRGQQWGQPAWQDLSDEQRRFEANKMEVHAAMVDRVDQGVGMLMDALEMAGELDNTLIFFLSDNGASPELPEAWGPGFDRPDQTRDGRAIQYGGIFEVGGDDTFAGLGPAWANAVNTPFRFWKATSFHGGKNTPLIAHWPDGLNVAPGQITRQKGHIMDIMPTCLELAGVDYPSRYRGHDINPPDGKSLTPVFNSRMREGHERLFFEHEGTRAVIEGDWKLLAMPDEPWQLYDLANDFTETNDVADRYPDKVNNLQRHYRRWAGDVGM